MKKRNKQIVKHLSIYLFYGIFLCAQISCMNTVKVINDEFPNEELLVVYAGQKEKEKILSEDESFDLVIVVKENNCLSCIKEITEYNWLNDNVHRNNLKITMVYQGKIESCLKLIEQYGIKFRVLLDSENKISFDEFYSTPVKFLVQKLGNRSVVVFTNFKNNSPEKQKKFRTVVNEIVHGLFY